MLILNLSGDMSNGSANISRMLGHELFPILVCVMRADYGIAMM